MELIETICIGNIYISKTHPAKITRSERSNFKSRISSDFPEQKSTAAQLQ